MLQRIIDPGFLQRLQPVVWLALRLYLGWFLVVGVWDNISSPERMAEFAEFLAGLGCPAPAMAAPVSVWAQFVIGLLLIPGLFTRLAGLVLAINFSVAVWLFVGAGLGEREIYDPAILIFVGLLLAVHGAGAWSADAALLARARNADRQGD